MKKPKEIIKKLIEKHQKKKAEKERVRQERIAERIEKQREMEANRPRYKIDDLYVGKIIYIKSSSLFVGPNASIYDSGERIQYRNIKQFAIFDKSDPYKDYVHVVTSQSLRDSLWGEAGEYVVDYDSIKEFSRAMQGFMIKNNLTKYSLLSYNQIKEIEKQVNLQRYPEQKQDELFW